MDELGWEGCALRFCLLTNVCSAQAAGRLATVQSLMSDHLPDPVLALGFSLIAPFNKSLSPNLQPLRASLQPALCN